MQHTETGSENVVTNHSNSYHRGSQTFSGHVPFSISADEYVPLKMGAGRIFSGQERLIYLAYYLMYLLISI